MSRSRTHRETLAVALACAVAGTLLIQTAAASAQPSPQPAPSARPDAPRAHAATSRGFRIYNLSSHSLRLLGAEPLQLLTVEPVRFCEPECYFGFEGRPVDGDVLKPGAPPHHWEIKHSAGYVYGAKVKYAVVGTGDVYTARMIVYPYHNDSSCTIGPGACTAGGLTLTVIDPPGTVHDIPATDAQQQADTLQDLCTKTSSAKCDFTPTARRTTNTPKRLVGDAYANCTDLEQETRFKAEDTVGQSNSVGIDIGTEFETNFIVEKVKFSITAKYKHDWTWEHKFSQDEILKVKPGYLGWVSATSPVVRDTGEFTLKLASTTWHLHGVYFDSPNAGGTGIFTANGKAMTAAQKVDLCADAPPGGDGLVPAPDSSVSMQRSGTGGDDTLLGGRASNTMLGKGGDDVIRGAAGNDTLRGARGDDEVDGGVGRDTLVGGRGRDALHGGAGRDTLRGGAGADTIIDTSGPTLVQTGADTGRGHDFVNVRDGRADDKVVCGSRRSTVVADRGDRVIGPCGDRAPTG